MADASLQTVDRALALLELLAHYPRGLRPLAIAAAMQLNKVAVHRLLSTLEQRSFVERQADGSYVIGLRLVAISSMRLNNLELKTEAQPWLRRLVDQVNQPVHLAIEDQGEVVYIDKVEAVHSIRMYSQIGKRSPIHCTALGKVLLAAMPPAAARTLLNQKELQRYTSHTVTDLQALLDELDQVRRQGYALDREEHEPGVFCAAAPIYDYRGQVIAAISTAGSRQDYLDVPDHPVIASLLDAAAGLSQRMGYDPEMNRRSP